MLATTSNKLHKAVARCPRRRTIRKPALALEDKASVDVFWGCCLEGFQACLTGSGTLESEQHCTTDGCPPLDGNDDVDQVRIHGHVAPEVPEIERSENITRSRPRDRYGRRVLSDSDTDFAEPLAQPEQLSVCCPVRLRESHASRPTCTEGSCWSVGCWSSRCHRTHAVRLGLDLPVPVSVSVLALIPVLMPVPMPMPTPNICVAHLVTSSLARAVRPLPQDLQCERSVRRGTPILCCMYVGR